VTHYPSVADVLAAHARLILLFGGAEGLRDRAALEAALGRPQSGYFRDVIERAAALLESLSQNHPFMDGNKRTAIAVTAAFLRVNGFRLDFDDLDAYQFLMQLYEANQFRFQTWPKRFWSRPEKTAWISDLKSRIFSTRPPKQCATCAGNGKRNRHSRAPNGLSLVFTFRLRARSCPRLRTCRVRKRTSPC